MPSDITPLLLPELHKRLAGSKLSDRQAAKTHL